MPSFGFSSKKPDVDITYKCVKSAPDTLDVYEAQENGTVIKVLTKYSSAAGWPKYNSYPIVHRVTHDSMVVVQTNEARYNTYYSRNFGDIYIDASGEDNPITSKSDALSRISSSSLTNYYGVGSAIYGGALLVKAGTYILIFDRQTWNTCSNRWLPNLSYYHDTDDVYTVFEYYV